ALSQAGTRQPSARSMDQAAGCSRVEHRGRQSPELELLGHQRRLAAVLDDEVLERAGWFEPLPVRHQRAQTGGVGPALALVLSAVLIPVAHDPATVGDADLDVGDGYRTELFLEDESGRRLAVARVPYLVDPAASRATLPICVDHLAHRLAVL